MALIDRAFANSDHETRSESEESFARGFLNNFRLIFRLAEMLGLFVVISIALAAANFAAMSVRERQREIAIMRALGFAPRAILSLALVEALIVAFAAGVAGCGAAFLALRVVALRMSTVGIPPSIIGMSAKVVAESIGGATILGLVSAAIPYVLAVRRDLIGSLRALG
jgi:putative ABC transport system permease protein